MMDSVDRKIVGILFLIIMFTLTVITVRIDLIEEQINVSQVNKKL